MVLSRDLYLEKLIAAKDDGYVKVITGIDLYVTGSNSKMLSDEVATHFRDRGEVIRMHPLTFSEYFKSSGLSEYQAWNRYLIYGGMPEAVLKKTDDDGISFVGVIPFLLDKSILSGMTSGMA